MDVLDRLLRLWCVLDTFEELLRPIRYLSEVADVVDATNRLRHALVEAEQRFESEAPRQTPRG